MQQARTYSFVNRRLNRYSPHSCRRELPSRSLDKVQPVRSILAFDRPAIRRAKGFECVDRSKASTGAITVRGEYCSLTFDGDNTGNAISGRVKWWRLQQISMPIDADIRRCVCLIDVALMARLDDVWQRVARFHPSVACVDSGNSGHSRGRCPA